MKTILIGVDTIWVGLETGLGEIQPNTTIETELNQIGLGLIRFVSRFGLQPKLKTNPCLLFVWHVY